MLKLKEKGGEKSPPLTYLDSNGETVVYYEYDAWGNHAVVDADGNDVKSCLKSSL